MYISEFFTWLIIQVYRVYVALHYADIFLILNKRQILIWDQTSQYYNNIMLMIKSSTKKFSDFCMISVANLAKFLSVFKINTYPKLWAILKTKALETS